MVIRDLASQMWRHCYNVSQADRVPVACVFNWEKALAGPFHQHTSPSLPSLECTVVLWGETELIGPWSASPRLHLGSDMKFLPGVREITDIAFHGDCTAIFPHQRYVGWSCVLNCFMLSSLPCFYAFCWSAIPTSSYIFNVFYSCSCHFFSSRCMLKLKFAIYYRAASLPSQASYAVLAEESLTRPGFKHSRTPTVFLIQQYFVIITFRC